MTLIPIKKHDPMPEEFVPRLLWKVMRRCRTCFGIGGGCGECRSWGFYQFGQLDGDRAAQ
jgi:hypothetical protein